MKEKQRDVQSPYAPGSEAVADESERADPALPEDRTGAFAAGHLQLRPQVGGIFKSLELPLSSV